MCSIYDTTRHGRPRPPSIVDVGIGEFIGPTGRYTCVCKQLVSEFITDSWHSYFWQRNNRRSATRPLASIANDGTTGESGSCRMTLKVRPRRCIFPQRNAFAVLSRVTRLYRVVTKFRIEFLPRCEIVNSENRKVKFY